MAKRPTTKLPTDQPIPGNAPALGRLFVEQTGPQLDISVFGFEGELIRSTASYKTYREMRRDPVIALARALSIAPVIGGEWSVVNKGKDVPDEWWQLIHDEFLPIRASIVEQAMYANVDFGWVGFEIVHRIRKDGLLGINKVKPLLQDITTIVVSKDTGAFFGLKQTQQREIVLTADMCLLVSFRVEGTNWYGEPLLENVRAAWEEWKTANNVAATYDKKVAGSKLLIKYPPGQNDVDGKPVNNSTIARMLIKALETSGAAAVPKVTATMTAQLTKEFQDLVGWEVDYLSDGQSKQHSFIPRLEYLDKRMLRGMLLPERAVTEGRFGTRAEAGEHADLALTHTELLHEHVTRSINQQMVDRILVLNFGEEARGSVCLEATPLADDSKQFFRDLYMKIIESDTGFVNELPWIDTQALRDKVGIPENPQPDPDIAVQPLPGIDEPSDENDDELLPKKKDKKVASSEDDTEEQS